MSVSPAVTPRDALLTPVADLPGVGPTRARQLLSVGVATLHDLLHYFPRDYQYVSALAPIGELQPNTLATAEGEVVAVDYIAGPRPRFEATLKDDTGALSLTFFNSAYLRSKIHPGMRLKVTGKLKFFRNLPQMQNPKWVAADAPSAADDSPAPTARRATLRPVYPASGRLTSDVLAKLIESVLPLALPAIPETLPPGLLARRDLLPRQDAYRLIHLPGNKAEALDARRRLVYDELFVLQMGLLLSRRRDSGRLSAPMLRCDKLLDQRIRARFPFDMTTGQLRATYDIVRDLGSGKAMNRLLQGDVGSGKTAVALYAMLVAVANKMQAALLAPTEVLAEQHYLTLSRFLEGSSVTVELFTSRTKKQSRGGLARALADGRIHIAVGTQALLQQDMAFANLGLVVVDEQHRLGVKQRATLRGKGGAPGDAPPADNPTAASLKPSPHYLVMTATPIPRTLALSYFADFDLSVIDELPAGRTPVETQWLRATPGKAATDHRKAWELIRREAVKGHQAYIVVPRIGDEGSDLDVPDDDETTSLLREFKRLSEGPLQGLRLEMLHGRMPPEERQAVMTRFRDRQADVLVATTVIEVGVDVPNATVIAILDADRFGLSQLHQLRGRVGRGPGQSHCLLLSEAPEPSSTDLAASRLTALTSTHSGFEIAELDLRLRGPGQFFGTRQHGLPEFRLADLTNESDLLLHAREDAQWLATRDPHLQGPEVRQLRAEILKEFADALPLASVG